MAKSNPSPITQASRRARQQRGHGATARCAECGVTDPAVLVARSRPKRCEACYRTVKGRTTFEDHHPAGHANSAYTVSVNVNSHRRLSDTQNDWDPDTLQNFSGDPLLAAAAQIRGFVETCKDMIENLLLWIVELLEAVSAWLSGQHGPTWWVGSPIERWALNQ